MARQPVEQTANNWINGQSRGDDQTHNVKHCPQDVAANIFDSFWRNREHTDNLRYDLIFRIVQRHGDADKGQSLQPGRHNTKIVRGESSNARGINNLSDGGNRRKIFIGDIQQLSASLVVHPHQHEMPVPDYYRPGVPDKLIESLL